MEFTKVDLVSMAESTEELLGMSEYLVSSLGTSFVPNIDDLCHDGCVYPDLKLTDKLPLPIGVGSLEELNFDRVCAGFEKAYLKKIGEYAASFAG